MVGSELPTSDISWFPFMKSWPRSYPLAALVAVATIAPIVVLFLLAGQSEGFFDGRTFEVLINTLLLTLFTVAGSVLLGVPLALLTSYCELPGRRFWLVALAAPLALPSYIGAFTFYAAFGAGGEIEKLTGIMLPRLDGIVGSSIVMTLYSYPFVLLTTRASLRSLDGNLVNAARTLGLTLGQSLWRVVLPRVRNGIAAGALLVALYTLSDFGTPAIMQFDTFTRVIFTEYNAFALGRAALFSLQLLFIVVLVLIAESRFRTFREASGRILAFRPGKLAVVALFVAVAALLGHAIGLPMLVFGTWLAREGAGDFEPLLAWHSILASLLAAIGAIACAIPVAYAATAGKVGRLLERVTYLGYGVPGIVMGTALVYLGLKVSFLYQTLGLLVIAYVLRFLPLAVGSVRSTLERVDGNLVHAARTLGATPGEVFRRVSFPLALRGVVAGGALVFLESMRELPATLLLQPTGYETLATQLWLVYEAGYFGRAAVPGLLLVVFSGIGLAFLLAGERRAERLLFQREEKS